MRALFAAAADQPIAEVAAEAVSVRADEEVGAVGTVAKQCLSLNRQAFFDENSTCVRLERRIRVVNGVLDRAINHLNARKAT